MRSQSSRRSYYGVFSAMALVALAVCAAAVVILSISLRPAQAAMAARRHKAKTVHVTGNALKMKGGDYVKLTFGTGSSTFPTAYGRYETDVAYGTIVTAKICDNDNHQVSKIVAGAASEKKDGGDARNGTLAMPTLTRQ